MSGHRAATLALPLLRMVEPELAHRLALRALQHGFTGRADAADPAALEVRALGLSFSNPLGLAAGFDKNGVAIGPLMRLGFGFVEVGTVTPQPQAGNPFPRVFRLPADRALINRLGFNNDGAAALCMRLATLPRLPAPLGINIGINRESANPEADYAELAGTVARFAAYITINVSSPNTPGLRDLQGEQKLRSVLAAIKNGRNMLPPLLVKLAPDLSDAGLATAVEAACEFGVEGLIISNTTIARPADLRGRSARQAGGLSGAPLFARSTDMLRTAFGLARGRLTLIGCGGIRTGRDVFDKIQAGAALVQLYTEFAYAGPALISRLKRELIEAMDAAHCEKIADAVGQRA